MSAVEFDAHPEHASTDNEPAPHLHLVDNADEALLSLRYNGWRRHLKRLIDVAIAGAAMLVAVPLMLAIALVVTWSSPGPVLFRQHRIGKGGRAFRIVKFRTMYVDAEQRLRADPELYAAYVANDYKLDLDVDPRITPIGRFLRKSSLDELPQLFNVLGGTMSLVGPRPVVPEELACYGDVVASYLQLLPGLTGRWQIEGRNFVRYPERAYLDDDYLRSWHLRSDLKIIAKTVPLVLGRRGCH